MKETPSDLLDRPADAERASRITGVFARGIEAARKTYKTYRQGVTYYGDAQDRALVGGPLLLAHALLRQGDDDSKLAAEIVHDLVEMQERHPRHPHRGNWPRWVGDNEITDLNSGPFILRWLIPLLIEHGHQLPPELQARCRECVHLGLAELERTNVSVIYTNIHLMSTFALIVGGQWLRDTHFQELGKQRWAHWVRYTVQSGAPREFNSVTYMGMDLTMLDKLQQYALDPEIRFQARLLHERVWLHVALHFHRPTGQLAGPHSRMYWGAMLSGRAHLTDILWRETGWPWTVEPGPYTDRPLRLPSSLELALTEHRLPPTAKSWLETQEAAMPYEVREAASVEDGLDLTTYFSPGYALGTCSRTYSVGTDCLAIELMANYMMLHYARPGRPGGWGMMYSRYVVNDQHFGALLSFPGRPPSNFYDQGHFAGVQVRNKAIGLYALMPQHNNQISSLKSVVAFQSGGDLEKIWVNGVQVHVADLPRSLELGDWVIIQDGAVYVGVRPLEPSCLGRETPLMLERGPLGELWVTAYNYRGVSKRFWDYGSLGGAYWNGNLRAGCVVEVAERTAYDSAASFLMHLRLAEIEDTVDDRRVRTVSYRSGGDELSIEYDLWNTRPGGRRINGAVYDPPNLRSPCAVQGDSGKLEVGEATLETHPQQVWLIAQELAPTFGGTIDGRNRAWIAVNPQDRPTPLTFRTPLGVVSAEAWGMGRLEWRAPVEGGQSLIVEALAEPEGLRVPEGIEVRYILAQALNSKKGG